MQRHHICNRSTPRCNHSNGLQHEDEEVKHHDPPPDVPTAEADLPLDMLTAVADPPPDMPTAVADPPPDVPCAEVGRLDSS